jgi:hypothetical protein
MKLILFVFAAVVLGFIGILGIYFRFVAVLVSIAFEAMRVALTHTTRVRSRAMLRLPTYDH